MASGAAHPCGLKSTAVTKLPYFDSGGGVDALVVRRSLSDHSVDAEVPSNPNPRAVSGISRLMNVSGWLFPWTSRCNVGGSGG